jgi:Rrf2 family protein
VNPDPALKRWAIFISSASQTMAPLDRLANCNYTCYKFGAWVSREQEVMSGSSRFTVAVHVLTLMACCDDEPVKSEQIAASVNTNPVVIRRTLCELAKGELVISHTGAAGGSRLARKPEQITLLDVYRTVEASGVFSLHRQQPNRHCQVGARIGVVLEGVRGEIDSAMERVLAKITIEDVLTRVQNCGPKSTGRGGRRID